MSNILTGILNEANPYRISEPEREYGAPAQSRPRMGPQEPEDVPDDMPPEDPFKQNPAKLAKVEYSKDEGEAPNGKRYNMIMQITGPANSVRNEVDMFNNHHWGAKKIVDMKTIEAKTPNGPAKYTVYIVDNHKYGMWTPFRDEKPVGEPLVFKESQSGISASELADILYNRLEMRYPDIVSRYGHEVVGDVVMDVADFHEGAEELGTSDIGGMIRQIVSKLENYNVDESKKSDPYGDDYQAMVNRVGQLAKQGERKTVYDPVKRVYKTVPVNPPKQQGVAEASTDTNLAEPTSYIQVKQLIDKMDKGGKKRIANALRKNLGITTQDVAEEYELAGVGVAYELGRKAYKQGMTIRDNPYSATKEARKYDEWEKGLERGKYDAIDAKRFRSSIKEQGVDEGWSQKYKNSINCSHPKGFSQKAHCAGKKKHNESVMMEMVCEDCGMCETHGDHTKDKLDELKCWSGFHRVAGTKAGFPGSCAKNKTNEEGMAEGIEDNYNKNDAGIKAALQAGVKLIPIQPNNDATGKPIYIHDYSGRYTVAVDMGGISVPFYVSTGLGGKAGVAVDKWYPFFGIGPDGWINKGSEEIINDFYGSNKLKRVAQVLNNTLGLPSRAKNVSGWSVNRGDGNYFISAVNRGLDPAALSDRSTKLRDNMLSVLRGLGEPNKYVEKHTSRPKAYAFDKNNPEHVAAFDATSQSEREIAMALAKDPKSQGVAEEKCPHCSGPMFSELMINEKKDACYYKVKSRYKVWPSAYASGALVKCRNKGASNWGNSTKNEGSILEGINRADESLHDWFNKEKWVRMDTKGNIKGPCAKEPGEGKPKCLPQSKAHSLGKKGRASAAQRKRREDPNPDRSGKAINVDTKKK
jgi:hypothetical protein